MKQMRRAFIVAAGALLALVATPASGSAQVTNLASAETFGVLAGSTLTNTGATTVNGDVGVGPGGDIAGTAVTISAGGAIHEGDAVAVQAQLDALEAYDELVERTCINDLTGQDLGGKNLTPGV
jgi:hypothetical protein